jgi:GNAT superfamily N-acetyltransferase
MTVEAQMATEQLRLIKISDVPDANELSAEAGWNQTPADWRMLLDISDGGCVGIEIDGRLVSTTTLVCYQQRLAWIGMVLTKPGYRGRGLARRLLTYVVEYADSLGIQTIKLDATEQGMPLYQKAGFTAEQPVERWSRPGAADSQTFASGFPLTSSLLDLDRPAFGADRSAMLQELAARSNVYSTSDAFTFSRNGRTSRYLGPCVASDPLVARKVITKLIIQSSGASWSWDLLPANWKAVALASELGFSRQRCLTRMTRGKPLRGRDDMIYAIAGFELG